MPRPAGPTCCLPATGPCIVLLLTSLRLAVHWSPVLAGACALFGACPLLGVWDLLQTQAGAAAQLPADLAHFRYFLEIDRPGDPPVLHRSPTTTNCRSRASSARIVYQRAKDVLDKRPFGTQRDVYGDKYEWINHSMQPRDSSPRTTSASPSAPSRAQPYSASVFNISAMSFGSLSANAIRALNEGAKRGGFYHDTGEGSISRLPPRARRRPGLGDRLGLLRLPRRRRPLQRGKLRRATPPRPQVKMIELKLSQGAKPGHGGVLPAREGQRRRSPRRAACRSAWTASRRRDIRPSPRRSNCCSSSTGCASCRAASRPASSWRSGIPGNGSRSPRRCTKPACCRTSSSWTAARAAPAPRRWSSPTTSARRCARRCCWCTTPWSAWTCAEHVRIGAAGKIDHRLRHRAHARAGRRLVQCRARLHVLARLHPVAELPHRSLPDRRRHAGPAAAGGAGSWPTRPRACTSSTSNTLMALRELMAAAGLRPSGRTRPRAHHPPRVLDRGALAGGAAPLRAAGRTARRRAARPPGLPGVLDRTRAATASPPPAGRRTCGPASLLSEIRGILPRFRVAPEKRGFRALPRRRCAASRRHIPVPVPAFS